MMVVNLVMKKNLVLTLFNLFICFVWTSVDLKVKTLIWFCGFFCDS